ncbi:hypothetical protein [Actinomycetospora termitidis]|uniref:Uncharacterized protein n=1 Tax=Actinomycetospora termitidis TaxID=3053470 RepID=A0ABT7MBU9_9PSEU|nr:hypothetical protein [Actinomycetospora sp. Odt1-22]MDL5158151.1 hypothetical protein [Actinomycetospora sp. Odt1-22]
MRTTVAAVGVVLVVVVLIHGRSGGLGMTLGGAAVLALFAGIAVWIRRTMSHH